MQKIKLLIIVLVSLTSLTSCQNKNLTTSYSKIPKLYSNNNAVVSVTAYCASEDRKYKNKNAIGGYMRHGRTIATDWSVFPVGTVMKIDGKTYTVEDYGSALVRPHPTPIVDLYVSNKKQIRQWGKREKTIEVVKWGSFADSLNILKDRLGYAHCRKMYYAIKSKFNL